MASWLVRLSPDQVVRVRALAGDIVLCSWARHFTLTVPLSTQEYKWVPVNCWGKPNKLLGNDLRWTSIPSRGSRILLAASCYGNRDKLQPDEPVGSKGFTSPTFNMGVPTPPPPNTPLLFHKSPLGIFLNWVLLYFYRRLILQYFWI